MLLAITLLVGCSGGGGSGSGSVIVSGVVTYDRVPFSVTAWQGLDFNSIQSLPARGVSVQVLDDAGLLIGVATTDEDGAYSVGFIPSNQLVRVRVFAELSETSLSSTWEVKILDHTDGDAQYVLNGQLASSGSIDSIRNLHAESGWDSASSSYSEVRAAAPFAILDSIYTGLRLIASVESDLMLGLLEVFWSPKNNAASVDFDKGDIGSSFYRNHQIYLLGKQNSDTDEYDPHVIIHEWTHFLEASLSRSDTIGGGHNIVESLDIRLAFSEGLANAFSAIMMDDPLYRDSYGAEQGEDFHIDIEANPDAGSGHNVGWFVESSIHSLLYDFYDLDNEGVDNISAGFGPIYDVLTDSDYINESSFLSIYPFVDRFRSHAGVDSAAVGQLLSSQNISGVGSYGLGEVNRGGDFVNALYTLPIYTPLSVNGLGERVCSTNVLVAPREVNKLGNRRFIRFTTTSGDHTITVTYAGTGFMPSNPAFVLYRNGEEQLSVPAPGSLAYDVSEDSVTDVHAIGDAGEYIIEVFSRGNVDDDSATGGDVCFDVSVSR
ncbi:MAG: hypothetical protein ACJAUP_000552 [Cellvibrionaceae bacterium]|jgi:hypothetical protein